MQDIDNNPFIRFGIKHLSATSMLQFRNDPALGIIYAVLGVREPASPPMYRGTVLDEIIGLLLTQNAEPDIAALKAKAEKKFRSLVTNDQQHHNPRYVEQERNVLIRCIDSCLPLMKFWEKPLAYQYSIELEIADIGVPIKGFIDLLYPGEVRELKSTVRPKPEILKDHAFQISTYAMAIQQETGEWPEACVDYITPDHMQSYVLDDIEKAAEKVLQTALNIRDFLSPFETQADLRKAIQPNFRHSIWKYRPKSKQAALDFFLNNS